MDQESCKICGNQSGNKLHTARERMFDLGGAFQYLECASCGCLQLLNPPADMAMYYPANYYSYHEKKETGGKLLDRSLGSKVKRLLKKAQLDYSLGKSSPTGRLLSSQFDQPIHWMRKEMIHYDSKILDVGCGYGKVLLQMHGYGFKNVSGIDPFIEKDIAYSSGVRIEKKFIREVEGPYDFVMLHHSFEHMDNPLQVFKEIYRLLAPNRYALIRIPVAGSFAWRKYGVNWVQLDAPRHIFLHTTQSIQLLAEQSNLVLKDVMYDSTRFQFTRSEQYLRNIPFSDKRSLFSKEQLAYLSKEAQKRNQLNDGDQACFYLYKA